MIVAEVNNKILLKNAIRGMLIDIEYRSVDHDEEPTSEMYVYTLRRLVSVSELIAIP